MLSFRSVICLSKNLASNRLGFSPSADHTLSSFLVPFLSILNSLQKCFAEIQSDVYYSGVLCMGSDVLSSFFGRPIN